MTKKRIESLVKILSKEIYDILKNIKEYRKKFIDEIDNISHILTSDEIDILYKRYGLEDKIFKIYEEICEHFRESNSGLYCSKVKPQKIKQIEIEAFRKLQCKFGKGSAGNKLRKMNKFYKNISNTFTKIILN